MRVRLDAFKIRERVEQEATVRWVTSILGGSGGVLLFKLDVIASTLLPTETDASLAMVAAAFGFSEPFWGMS